MGGSQGAVVQRAFGDSAGHYRLVVAGGAPYKLWFRSPQTPQYVEQHWNNKPNWATADAFTVTADDNTKDAQLDALEASATASCTLPLVSPNPILLPGGAVDVFAGTTLFKSFVADAAASFQLFGLAPNTIYLLRYKGTVANKIVE